MEKTQSYSAFGVSLGVHAVILAALAMITLAADPRVPEILIETVIPQERIQEEFSRELETETQVSESVSAISGGIVSTQLGSATGPTVSQQRIETSEALREPEIKVNPGELTVPGDELLGQDLGEGEVTGEIGAVVEGYGAAMSRLTQEIIRMMRQERLVVVWLFDESESMKDDQQEIRDKFHKVYEELRIAQVKDQQLKAGKEILVTSVLGFGERIHPLTDKPTADIDAIKAAIDKIPVDESGIENTCTAIREVVKLYRQFAIAQKRKLVIVVVTDESGDDGLEVEDALGEAKRANAPIYILGREAVFGYPYARIRWIDPVFKLTHWLRINRGPETEFPEQLQWDGLHGRWDVFSSGFGPYEQVRLCKESGGIFFVLPGEEEDLTGAGAHEQRQFDFLDMKPYQPLLLARRDYQEARDKSRFRKTIWEVIVLLNPNENDKLPRHDPLLNIREHHYSTNIVEFRTQAANEVQKAARAMSLLNQAIPLMEGIKPLRATEASQRWRANYDIIMAQLLAYRVRLFQYLLAMDHHANTNPQVTDPQRFNEWNVHRTPKMLEPDDDQFKRIQQAFNLKTSKDEYLSLLKQQEQAARDLYQFVIDEHPRTPWARRAHYELTHGFGMEFRQGFWDPRYREVGAKIKLPKP